MFLLIPRVLGLWSIKSGLHLKLQEQLNNVGGVKKHFHWYDIKGPKKYEEDDVAFMISWKQNMKLVPRDSSFFTWGKFLLMGRIPKPPLATMLNN